METVLVERISPDCKCLDLSLILIDTLRDHCSLVAPVPSKIICSNKRLRLFKIPAASTLAKGHNISLLVFWVSEKTHGQSPMIDFSEGCLEFHCAIFNKTKLPTQGLLSKSKREV